MENTTITSPLSSSKMIPSTPLSSSSSSTLLVNDPLVKSAIETFTSFLSTSHPTSASSSSSLHSFLHTTIPSILATGDSSAIREGMSWFLTHGAKQWDQALASLLQLILAHSMALSPPTHPINPTQAKKQGRALLFGLYLIHDILHQANKKPIPELLLSFTKVNGLHTLIAQARCHPEINKPKLEKVLNLWKDHHYFEPSFLETLGHPTIATLPPPPHLPDPSTLPAEVLDHIQHMLSMGVNSSLLPPPHPPSFPPSSSLPPPTTTTLLSPTSTTPSVAVPSPLIHFQSNASTSSSKFSNPPNTSVTPTSSTSISTLSTHSTQPFSSPPPAAAAVTMGFPPPPSSPSSSSSSSSSSHSLPSIPMPSAFNGYAPHPLPTSTSTTPYPTHPATTATPLFPRTSSFHSNPPSHFPPPPPHPSSSFYPPPPSHPHPTASFPSTLPFFSNPTHLPPSSSLPLPGTSSLLPSSFPPLPPPPPPLPSLFNLRAKAPHLPAGCLVNFLSTTDKLAWISYQPIPAFEFERHTVHRIHPLSSEIMDKVLLKFAESDAFANEEGWREGFLDQWRHQRKQRSEEAALEKNARVYG